MASIVSAGTTSATALNMSADTSGVLQLASNNGTVALTVDASQNVGIGTASPVGKLNLSGVGAGAALELTNTTASTGKSMRVVSLNAGGLAIEDTTASSATRVTIDTSGNMFVGGATQNTANTPVYSKTSAKAFVGWTGSSGAVIGTPYNVSSVTRTATGSYTVNYTNSLSSGNATVATGFQRNGTNDFLQYIYTQSSPAIAKFESFTGGTNQDLNTLFMVAYL
jgi:hypothetical protein